MEIPKLQENKIAHVREWTADRMKALRLAAGLTQPQLADKMGVHFSRISDFENNRSDYKASTVFRAAAAMGLNMEKVFRGCPDWKGAKKEVEQFVVVSTDRLEHALIESGIPPKRAALISARLQSEE